MTTSKLLKYMAELITKAEKIGLVLIDEKEINYGVQLKFSKDNEEIPLNLYYSKKKGISKVIGGSSKNKLQPILHKLLSQKLETTKNSHNWKIWAGTDESGKGDFFGALVVCGFLMHKKDLEVMRKLGITDSKQIKDKEAVKLGQHLFQNYSQRFEYIILKPEKYNELYADFRQQGKKLNELLAWMHSRVILNLQKKHDFEGAVVDKFASDKTLISSLKDMKKVNLLHHEKAESDLAVAAASIIARYLFLRSLKEQSEKYKMEFSKGASQKVIKNANEFAQKHSKEKLKKVAKIHFKTYDKIGV